MKINVFLNVMLVVGMHKRKTIVKKRIERLQCDVCVENNGEAHDKASLNIPCP